MMPETPQYEALFSRISARFRGGNNVDIVGVPSSILGTPTNPINDLAAEDIAAGRFDKPETPERTWFVPVPIPEGVWIPWSMMTRQQRRWWANRNPPAAIPSPYGELRNG